MNLMEYLVSVIWLWPRLWGKHMHFISSLQHFSEVVALNVHFPELLLAKQMRLTSFSAVLFVVLDIYNVADCVVTVFFLLHWVVNPHTSELQKSLSAPTDNLCDNGSFLQGRMPESHGDTVK